MVGDADPDRGEVVGELFKGMVESNSDVSANAAEAIAHLGAIRAELIESGSRLMAVGVHPDVRSGDADGRLGSALPRDQGGRFRGCFARRSAASTSTSACQTPSRRCAPTTGFARTCPC